MDSKSAPALGSVLAAFFVAAAGTAFAQPIAAPRAASLVEQHALAQQGLSIGLLTALFEIQLNMSVTSGKEDVCRHHLPAPATSGSFKFLRKDVATDTLDLVGELYYDRDCQNRYAHVHYTAQRQSCCLSTVTETATLYGPTGKKLGKVELTGSVRQFLNLRFSSTGTFTPVQGGELRFGYTCAFDFIPTFGRVPCRIAVVQTFASTGNDIASITPVNFMMNNDLSATLVARNAELAIGAGGSLGISVPNLTTLMITGDATPIGIGAGRGSLAEFSAFLQGPTSWHSTDTINNAKFWIALDDQATDFNGAIKTTGSQKLLATIRLDKTGSGSIIYSDNSKAAVRFWTLAN